MAHREQGWSRWYDDAPDHPKFLAAGHKGGWLYVCGQAYASKHGTDGLIPRAVVPRLSDVPAPMKVAAKLVEVGLWHDDGDHFRQHDYEEMQSTAAEREEKREQARERQRRSRERKRDTPPPVTRDEPVTSPVTHASVTLAEGEEELEGEEEGTTSDLRPDPDVTDEARQLTRQFAEAVKANGHAIPTANTKARDAWLIEMDRLLRLGPPGEGGHVPDPGEVGQVIAWCAADTGTGSYPGESVTVRSVPKFRERYSELRAKALAPSRNGTSKGAAYAARYRKAAAELERRNA